MSGGILGLGSLPQATGGGGILDNFSNMVGNNRDALMGLGAGLLSGQGWGAGMQGYLQGAQQDQRTRLIQQQQAELAQKKQAAQAVATKLGMPELAGDPDTALGMYKAMQLQKLSQSAPTEIQRNLAALGLQPGSDQYKAAYMKLAGLSKPTATWGVVSEDANGKHYGWIDASNTSIAPYGAETQNTNPYALNGKNATQDQTNSALFANRAAEAHQILNAKEPALTNGWQSTLDDWLPDSVSNRFISEDRQKADQAKINFVTAVLRKESGASISKDEFAQANRVYFPQPGDTPDVINQKRQARITAIKGLMGGAGNGYTPPTEWQNPAGAGQQTNMTGKETAKAVGAIAGKTRTGFSWSAE